VYVLVKLDRGKVAKLETQGQEVLLIIPMHKNSQTWGRKDLIRARLKASWLEEY
jgi:hypothetical protein